MRGLRTVRAYTRCGFAEPGAHQIDVMDAVIDNLQTWRRLQESPELPWCVGTDLDLDVMQCTQRA